MGIEDLTFLLALALAYICIFSSRCYQKTGSREVIVALVLIASAAPLLLHDRLVLTVFYAAFTLTVLNYFEFSYERRLAAFGRLANGCSEYQPQSKLLPLVADKISEVVQKNDFYLYSPEVGKLALKALATKGESPQVGSVINTILIQAFLFVHNDITAKWGEPSRGLSVSLLVERLNRNAVIFINTATVQNMADINAAAKHNLKHLFSLYYYDFYLKPLKKADMACSAEFAALYQEFERSLVKFPYALELASPEDQF